MKRLLLALVTTSLFAACGSAFAQSNATLEPVIVQNGNMSVDCTPPSSDRACEALHAQIRQNFSPREIGVLFGARTAYAESLTAFPRLVARYDALMREQGVAAYAKPRATSVAAK